MLFPKISIVTPSFNQGKYIEQTIQSVLSQNYPNLEYIIIDGGSTDETVGIIKKYEQHLAYWISEPDKGQTDAINKGFAKCTGEIFNWINSDDYYEPDALNNIAALFESEKKVSCVCGKEWGFLNENPQDKTLHGGSVIKEDVYNTVVTGIIDQPCTFFKTESIKAFFPLDVSLRYVMDRQLWLSYLLKYGQDKIITTDKIFTNFRLHELSKSVNEATYFENEFNRIKLSVLLQLTAPYMMIRQFDTNVLPLNRKWQIDISPKKLTAAFAFKAAQKAYIANRRKDAAGFMNIVKTNKGLKMSSKELRLWLLTNVIPVVGVNFLRKIKKLF